MRKIQEDKRIIEFEIAGYNSQIFISVSNSYDMESIINQKQKFITTKEDKLNHGIGLENVSRTVKKYDGDMRICQEINITSKTWTEINNDIAQKIVRLRKERKSLKSN